MSLQTRVRMRARSADEPHRASSQLELLFDFTFVIAVASLAHHFVRHPGRTGGDRRRPRARRRADRPQRRASPIAVGYAIAIPVAVFLLLTWALHAPIAPRPLLRARAVLSSCLLILLLPAFAEHVGVVVVLASIATISAAVVAITLTLERKEHR